MVIAVFCVLPLAMLRKVKSLWFTGFMAMTFVVFYVVAILVTLGAAGHAAGE